MGAVVGTCLLNLSTLSYAGSCRPRLRAELSKECSSSQAPPSSNDLLEEHLQVRGQYLGHACGYSR